MKFAAWLTTAVASGDADAAGAGVDVALGVAVALGLLQPASSMTALKVKTKDFIIRIFFSVCPSKYYG